MSCGSVESLRHSSHRASCVAVTLVILFSLCRHERSPVTQLTLHPPAPARPGKPRLPPLHCAVQAIGAGASPLVRGLLLKGRALQRAVAHRPEDAPPDNRGPRDARSEAATLRLIGEDRRRQRPATPRPPGHDGLVPQGPDPALERQGRDRPAHGAPCEAHATVGGAPRWPGHVGTQAALAHDERGGTVHTAWQVGPCTRQMVRPPSRTRAEWEWRGRRPPALQLALWRS
jgi:hypothetical protein